MCSVLTIPSENRTRILHDLESLRQVMDLIIAYEGQPVDNSLIEQIGIQLSHVSVEVLLMYSRNEQWRKVCETLHQREVQNG